MISLWPIASFLIFVPLGFYIGGLIGKHLTIPALCIALLWWGGLQVKHWFDAAMNPVIFEEQQAKEAKANQQPATPSSPETGKQYVAYFEQTNLGVVIKGSIPVGGLLPKTAEEGDCWFVHADREDSTFGFYFARISGHWHVVTIR